MSFYEWLQEPALFGWCKETWLWILLVFLVIK